MTSARRGKRVSQYRSEIAKIVRELVEQSEGSAGCDLIAKTAARARMVAEGYVAFVDEMNP